MDKGLFILGVLGFIGLSGLILWGVSEDKKRVTACKERVIYSCTEEGEPEYKCMIAARKACERIENPTPVVFTVPLGTS